MINSWSLLYDEIYGDDEMIDNTITPQESDEYDPIVTVGSGNTASTTFVNFDLTDENNNVTIDTTNFDSYAGDSYGYDVLNIDTSGYPPAFTTLSDNDDAIAHHVTTPTPGIETDNPRKYKEDESIKALQDYISTTYGVSVNVI